MFRRMGASVKALGGLERTVVPQRRAASAAVSVCALRQT